MISLNYKLLSDRDKNASKITAAELWTQEVNKERKESLQKVIGRSYEVRFKWRQFLSMFVILGHFARQQSIFFRNWASQT